MRQDGSNFEDAEASGGIGLPIPRCHEPAKPGATFSNIQALPEGSRIAHGSTYPFQLSAVERGNGRDGDGSQKLIPGTGSSTVTPVCDMPPAVCFDCICAKIPNLGADAGFLEHGASRDLSTRKSGDSFWGTLSSFRFTRRRTSVTYFSFGARGIGRRCAQR